MAMLLAVSLFVSDALAQTSAVLSGVVKDESGAVIPGVQVTILRVDTGRTRTVATNAEGRYTAPNLEAGAYEISAESSGFQKTIRTGIQLTVGQSATADIILNVGTVTQTVEIVGEVRQVETTSSTVKADVNAKMISELPLNGRDFSQLATLQAGVYLNPNMGQAVNAVQGAGPRISISGFRVNQNAFLLDGSNVQDAQNRTPSGASGQTLGVETVREFSVLTGIYPAEYGGRGGGVINAVTKAGTNELHGSVFEFLRNDNLDARNFFDGVKPEFKRNQFGFTVGGPIRRDKTFFFGSYEGLRDSLGRTSIQTTLSRDGRQGILGTRTFAIDPAVKPYVDLYPLPNGTDFGDGRGEFIHSVNTPTVENYYLVKLDHNFSDSDFLFGRYINDRSSILSPYPFPGFDEKGLTRRQFLTIGEQKIINPALLNEFRASFNRNIAGTVTQQTISLDPALSFLPESPFGTLAVSGLSSYGVGQLSNRILTQNVFQFSDTLLYTKERHLIKAGGHFERIQFNPDSAFARDGQWIFRSLSNFLTNKPDALQTQLPGLTHGRSFRFNVVAAFIQDDWRVTSRLTLNLGLRYEFSTSPSEKHGRISNLVNPDTDTQLTVVKKLYNNPGLKNFAPRFGFAWDVFGNGTTALRGGFGIYYSVFLPVDWIFTGTNLPPFQVRPSLDNPVGFPSINAALAASPGPAPFFQAMSQDPGQPYAYKYSLNIQRELFRDFVVTIGYNGSRGVHMSREQMLNINKFEILPDGRKFFPPGTTRRNPAFGPFSFLVYDTNSLYNALQISATKRFSHNFQFQFNYTYANLMNAADGNLGSSEVGGGTTGTLDPFDWKRDWGPAAYDVRNKATASFTYGFPRWTGWHNTVFGNWEVNGILILTDGSPQIITSSPDVSRSGRPASSGGHMVPDLKPGGNPNPVINTRDPNRYYDGSQFQLPQAGFLGNLGRNTGRRPGITTFDLSLNKLVPLGESLSLQFRAEGFNIFNRANFGNPNSTVFVNVTGVPSANFGRITSTTTSGRQIQLGLKLLF